MLKKLSEITGVPNTFYQAQATADAQRRTQSMSTVYTTDVQQNWQPLINSTVESTDDNTDGSGSTDNTTGLQSTPATRQAKNVQSTLASRKTMLMGVKNAG